MRHRHRLLTASLILVGLVFANHARAVVLEFVFDGTVNGVGLPIFGIHPAIGSAVTGSFSYDTALAPQYSGSSFVQYQIDTPYTLIAYIGGTKIESGGFFSMSIQNDSGGNVEDALTIGNQPVIVAGTQTLDGVFGLNFASRNPNTFASLSLPEHLNLSDFDAWRYGVLTRSGNNNEIFTFSVDRLTPVPLPETSMLLLSGLGMIAAAGRRRFKL